MNLPSDHPVIFFDGVCNLCNRFVQFVIRHDKKQQFLFASLQSTRGKAIAEHIRAEHGKIPDSVVLWFKGKYFLRSEAVVKILVMLGGFWKMGKAAMILPEKLRVKVYDWIAARRYRWFGKRDECMIPTPELRARFLED